MGEAKARNHLEQLGYTILEQNWRFKRAEIDIIAKHDGVLIFVEVKTRSYDYYGKPEEFLTARQEQLIIDAGSQYMSQIGHEWEIRFDIVAILLDKNGNFDLNHYKDAFFPSI